MLKPFMLDEHNDEPVKTDRRKVIHLFKEMLKLLKKSVRTKLCLKQRSEEDADEERWSDEGGR